MICSFFLFCSFLGLSQSVPVTSYVKMIDIWMLFTMTVPFLEVVYHTTNEVFKQPLETPVGLMGIVRVKPSEQLEEEEVETKNRQGVMKMTGKLILPISSLIFTMVFWIVGLIKSYFPDDKTNPSMTECLAIKLV